MDNLLSIVTFIPAIAALILAVFLRGDDAAAQRNAKWLALLATVSTFLISLFLYAQFDTANPGFQFIEDHAWIAGLRYKLGVDGISLAFVLLTTALMPVVIGACWNVTYRVKEMMIAYLVLETLMIGVFASLDLVLFYIFFEGTLIPASLLIGIWGGKARLYAAFKFFLYTFAGSVLMLVAMIAMYFDAGTTDIVALLAHDFASAPITVAGMGVMGGLQTLLFLGFLASFAVKLPMWPLHTWQPDAYAEAPISTTLVLSGILVKMGGYGFLRFSVGMFPAGAVVMADIMMWLSAIAIVYTSLVALVATDMKRLIAYASIAHMGFVTLGIFSATQVGMDGAVVQMISHGFVASGMFLCAGVVIDRLRVQEIDAFGGLVARMPVYALFFMFFTMANVGLPGTSGFVGEFLTLMGAFQSNTWVALFATSGVILAAAYGLRFYRRIMLGDLLREALKNVTDLSWREKAIFAPLIVMVLWLGLYPAVLTDLIAASTAQLTQTFQAAMPIPDPGVGAVMN
ncbi:NADH-quinone oxidoreductase subunit M [Falsirhodobacter halotolerans]|uniref:NADH-quinone oxidoreductase subunit M n=1 Tax=Falsirhodobacter halotolerans TaxID=1146892 RepID=UPI001FD3AB9B|nr:NADH-quinone oxidoreductase subunit M [Falsirhodobacter halotolerans]MCJ8140188.1 NADH-quinone oxidoreductase subunit M [Falsirhodobacter halotolerans]